MGNVQESQITSTDNNNLAHGLTSENEVTSTNNNNNLGQEINPENQITSTNNTDTNQETIPENQITSTNNTDTNQEIIPENQITSTNNNVFDQKIIPENQITSTNNNNLHLEVIPENHNSSTNNSDLNQEINQENEFSSTNNNESGQEIVAEENNSNNEIEIKQENEQTNKNQLSLNNTSQEEIIRVKVEKSSTTSRNTPVNLKENVSNSATNMICKKKLKQLNKDKKNKLKSKHSASQPTKKNRVKVETPSDEHYQRSTNNNNLATIVSSIKSEFSGYSFNRTASNTTTNNRDTNEHTFSVRTENNLSSDEVMPGNYGSFENADECNDDTTFVARNSLRERSKTRSRESSFENEANNQVEKNIQQNSEPTTSSEKPDQIIENNTNREQGNSQRARTISREEQQNQLGENRSATDFDNLEVLAKNANTEIECAQRKRCKIRSRQSSSESTDIHLPISLKESVNQQSTENYLPNEAENDEPVALTNIKLINSNLPINNKESTIQESTALKQNITSKTRNKNKKLKRKTTKIPLMLRRIQPFNNDPRELRKRRKTIHY